MVERLELILLLIGDEHKLSKEDAYWKAFPNFHSYSHNTLHNYLQAYEHASQGLKDTFDEQEGGLWSEFLALFDSGTEL